MGQDKASRADPKRTGRETTSTLVELYQPPPGRILGHHSNGMFARALKLKMRFREFWLKVTLSHASTYADCKAMSCDMDGIQIRRLSDILERYQAPGISYVGICQQVLPFSTAVVSKDLGKNWRQRSPRWLPNASSPAIQVWHCKCYLLAESMWPESHWALYIGHCKCQCCAWDHAGKSRSASAKARDRLIFREAISDFAGAFKKIYFAIKGGHKLKKNTPLQGSSNARYAHSSWKEADLHLCWCTSIWTLWRGRVAKNAIAEPRNSELPSCGVRTQKQRLELVQRAKGLRFNVRDKNSRFQVGERTALHLQCWALSMNCPQVVISKRFGTLEQSTVCKPNPMQRDDGDFLTCGYLIIQILSNPGQSDTPNSGTNWLRFEWSLSSLEVKVTVTPSNLNMSWFFVGFMKL